MFLPISGMENIPLVLKIFCLQAIRIFIISVNEFYSLIKWLKVMQLPMRPQMVHLVPTAGEKVATTSKNDMNFIFIYFQYVIYIMSCFIHLFLILELFAKLSIVHTRWNNHENS